jgi:3-oxoacyl-[acyl-carrier-protein] synthase II
MAAAHVSIRYGFDGLIGAPATACVASLQAIGDGARLIQMDEADVVVCGGAEAPIDRVSLSGFAAARVLSSRFNDEPPRSSRPFDANRDGFVMGEGAGIVVIESLDHARARGAQIIAEVLGYGSTSDAHHITSGHETGHGAAKAMRLALYRARLDPREVQLLNAHATSTISGDRVELTAIKSVFNQGGQIAVTSTKSSTGHLLGAAGAVGLIFSAQALCHQTAPPTLNLEQADPAADGVDLVRIVKRPMTIEHILTNGFGFGGINASILLRLRP